MTKLNDSNTFKNRKHIFLRRKDLFCIFKKYLVLSSQRFFLCLSVYRIRQDCRNYVFVPIIKISVKKIIKSDSHDLPVWSLWGAKRKLSEISIPREKKGLKRQCGSIGNINITTATEAILIPAAHFRSTVEPR